MAAPRIVKATCPQCGAGLHIAPGAAVVTCDYCKLSSFIERPDGPKTTPPTDGQRYGTIQIDPQAGRAILAVYLAIAAVMLLVGLGVAIAGAGRGAPTSPARDPFSNAPGSPACEKAVACCRVVLTGTVDEGAMRQTCNANRMMSDNDCVKQMASLRKTAQALHRTCN